MARDGCAGPAEVVHREALPFTDLGTSDEPTRARLMKAIEQVIRRGDFIMGREVTELEEQLSARSGARHAITCSSGTDALLLTLMAMGVGPGDAVVVPAFTFVAPAEAVALLGAQPVFCDVEPETRNIAPESARAALETAIAAGLEPRAIVAVDLFGIPADYRALRQIVDGHGVRLIADAAQSFGASVDGRQVGTLADITTTSFFPAKPLGCLGDGGAVFTDDDALAEAVRSLRLHGMGSHKYEHVRVGVNGRLDTIQAAVLIERLRSFDRELEQRREVAARYHELLGGVVDVPRVPEGTVPTWAQFTIRSPARDAVAARLRHAGIPSAIHYPAPIPAQPAFRRFPVVRGGVPVAEELSRTILSLPIHPHLVEEDQRRICDSVIASLDTAK